MHNERHTTLKTRSHQCEKEMRGKSLLRQMSTIWERFECQTTLIIQEQEKCSSNIQYSQGLTHKTQQHKTGNNNKGFSLTRMENANQHKLHINYTATSEIANEWASIESIMQKHVKNYSQRNDAKKATEGESEKNDDLSTK